MTPPAAALLAAILLVVLAGLHVALAAGAPLAFLAWGGQSTGRLPQRLRTGSAILAPIIAGMALVLLMRGRWLFPDEAVQMLLPCWGVFAFTVVQLFSARRSEATAERRFMTPFYIVIAALVAYVGLQSTMF